MSDTTYRLFPLWTLYLTLPIFIVQLLFSPAFAQNYEEPKRKPQIIQGPELGSQLDNFTAYNAFNQEMQLDYMLEYGALVIFTFEGGWSQRSTATLRELQSLQNSINQLGAYIIAISPDTPEYARKTILQNRLNFHLLHDKNGRLAANLKLSRNIPFTERQTFLHRFARRYGTSLQQRIGSNNITQMTHPALLIIAPDRSVIFKHYFTLGASKLPSAKILSVLKEHKGRY